MVPNKETTYDRITPTSPRSWEPKSWFKDAFNNGKAQPLSTGEVGYKNTTAAPQQSGKPKPRRPGRPTICEWLAHSRNLTTGGKKKTGIRFPRPKT